ncbi:MAG: hypothetical protein ACRELX_10385, partial [Longimicrobiales bacterium]
AQTPPAAGPPGAAPAAHEAPTLVFDREVFRYTGENRRDPFRPLTRQEDLGPVFNDLALRMIIFSPQPAQSVVVVADATGKVYRLRRGESLGNATVLDIGQTRVVFSVEDFGVRRQEVIDIKPSNSSEGA